MKSKKLISLLLAIALVIMSLPFNFILAGAQTDDSTQIDTIRNAWASLEGYDFEVTPTAAGSNITAALNAALPENVTADAAVVGSSYVKAELAAASTAKYDAATPSYGSNYVKYNQSTEEINGHNVYFSFYVDSIAEGETVSFMPFFRRKVNDVNGTGENTGKEYVITAEDAGKWVTLSLADLAGDNWSAVLNTGNHIILGIYSSVPKTIYFGSFIFNRTALIPEESAEWSLNKWKLEAAQVDLGLYDNGEVLSTALDSVSTEDEKKIYNFVNAYLDLEVAANMEIAPTKTVLGVAYGENAQLPEGVTADTKYVGKTYGKATFNSATATRNTVAKMGGSYVKYGGTADNPNDYDGVYFSFYVASVAGNMSVIPYFRKSDAGGDNTGKEYIITAEDAGKWVTLSASELIGEKYSDVTNLNNAIVLGINSDTAGNEIYVGSFIFTNKINALPEGAEDWSLNYWKSFVNTLDTTDYYNVDGLLNVFEASSTEIDRQNYALQDAFATMDKNIMESYTQPVGEGFTNSPTDTPETTVRVHDTVNPIMPEGVSSERLIAGLYHAKVVTAKTTTNSTPSSLGSSWIRYSSLPQSHIGCEIKFSFYIEELKGELSFVPFFRQGGTYQDTGKLYTVTQEDVGHWVTLTLEDLAGSNFYNISNISNNIILGINSTEQNTIYFGSFIFTEKAAAPAATADYTVADWSEYYLSLNKTAYYNTETFINTLRSFCEAEDMNCDQRLDSQDLTILTQLLLDFDVQCLGNTDINKDNVFDLRDFVCAKRAVAQV